ncbi:UNVERIFIED_CONTAM: NADH-ubiquinone oxidoreductase chain 4 [Trichonephila clavipes]
MLTLTIILPSIGALATYIKGTESFSNFSIGIDGISLYFVILTTFLIPICICTNSTISNCRTPLAGSIILAGIILKLALYGYIRIILQFIPDASHYYAPLIQTFAIITLIYASLATLRQTDFKALVAYSSVAHAATIVLGVFSNTVQGIEGAIFLGIAHAFVSPALFILVGGVLYDRYHSRIIKYYRGITTYIPIFSVFFFVFSISNAAVPLTASGIVLSAAYIILGVFPNIILNNLHVSVKVILVHLVRALICGFK